eukprot:TRINITY_DN52891_c0_g1_i1.p2 TRINITY_DN52891_c0_g1~~TRINITY_DN52891_c0_g1_i1.p2  ORF type:complete len:150 (+),score=56.66 TRINITY_DN52891_c0_g1_i1:40-450(+)
MIIRVVGDNASTQQWDLLELQGVPKALDGGSLDGKVIGQLRYSAAGGKASVQVGNTLLEGDVKAIAKPFVLLEKRSRKSGAKRKREDEGEGAEEAQIPPPAQGEEDTYYTVVGTVTRQFLLKTSRHYPPTASNIQK